MRISDWRSDVCSSDLVGVAGVHLVERCPDAPMIMIVGAAGDRDPRAFGNEHGLVRALPRRDKIAGIDHRGCHGLAVDQRTAARGPGAVRSEEHTSELQSLMRISYAVFCLKKKNKTKT